MTEATRDEIGNQVRDFVDAFRSVPVHQSDSEPALPVDLGPGPRTVQMTDSGPSPDAIQKHVLDAWRGSAKALPDAVDMHRDFARANPDDAARHAMATHAMPDVGQDFLGFELIAELGRGAFGRVFLAKQGSLANRFVALKIGTDLFAESQTLAQMQHTNIVPIYSVHRAGALQAVCMPFCGSTTFGQLVQSLEKSRSMPASGEAIVSTLKKRHSITQTSPSSAPKAFPSSVFKAALSGVGEPDALPAIPALGTHDTTEVVQLQKLGYVDAILWVAARLMEGLAHAHDRGIVHRDLKPANILLSDEGQPMLLDFNLSEDIKLRGTALGALMGGTLPYMAPEQLEAFRGKGSEVDSRSDLYSIGVILYELLHGQHPFPRHTGRSDTVLPQMVQDRLHLPQVERRWNQVVSPAVSSILRHCLETNPADRYQSAHELGEDLERHLANLPLRYAKEASLTERAQKWVRRHPRWMLAFLVTAAAGLLIGIPSVWFVLGDRTAAKTARETREFAALEMPAIQAFLSDGNPDVRDLDEGLRRNRAVVDRYHVLESPSWRKSTTVTYLPPHEQARLVEDMHELLYLQARGLGRRAAEDHDQGQREARLREALQFNELAEREAPDGTFSRAGWLQRADIVRQLGLQDEARTYEARAAEALAVSARDRFHVAMEMFRRASYCDALALLQDVTRDDPANTWAWFCQGNCHLQLGQPAEAVACYNICVAQSPQSYVFHYNRGLAYQQQQRLVLAAYDLDEAIRARPELPEPHLARGTVHAERGEQKEAVQEFSTALGLGASQTRIYFLRARSLDQLGDAEAAARDRQEGFNRVPTDEISWTARGLARLPQHPQDALADFDEALRLNPRYFGALQNKAHVLAELLNRPEDALSVMDEELRIYPDFVLARLGRGVIRARLGKREAALEDAKEALDRDRGPATYYQLANIYALTSQKVAQDKDQALLFLSRALQGGFGAELADADSDFDPIRKLPEFNQIVEAAKKLRAATAMQNSNP